jgi:hypothetical protein
MADAVEELGDKDGGLALRISAVDPLQRHGANMRTARVGASGAERGERSFCLCGWFDASDENRVPKRPRQSITVSDSVHR